MGDSSQQRRQMKHTACPNRALLVALEAGDLPPDVTNELAIHVERCSACELVLQSVEDSPGSLLPELRGATPADVSRAQHELGLQQSYGDTKMMELLGAGAEIQQRLKLPCDFGQYRLDKHAGRGGMGDVYLGIHKSLDRRTAIKLLRPNRTTSEAAADRFKQEMRVVAKLDHPNLVKAYDGGECEGRLYLAMELLDGETLADYVKRKGPFTPRRACQICIRAARGLQHAHNARSYHRDIKPGNIMLTREGKVKVLDLGLALIPHDVASGNRKDSLSFAGTPEFMPPEQAKDAASADARSDIYALGCTLYFLLTGSSLYPRSKYPSVADCISAHQNEPIPDIRLANSEVPDELAMVLNRMLCKDPNGRPQTALEVCQLLESFSQGDSGDSAEPADSDFTSKPVTLGSMIQHWWKSLLVAALVVVTGMSLYFRSAISLHLRNEGQIVLTGDAAGVTLVATSNNGERFRFPVGADRTLTLTAGEYDFTAPENPSLVLIPSHVLLTRGSTADIDVRHGRQLDDQGDPVVLRESTAEVEVPPVVSGDTAKISQEPANRTADGFPLLSGFWHEGSHRVVLHQREGQFIARCRYTNAKSGDVQWIMAGTVTQDGSLAADLWHIEQPNTRWVVQKRTGMLQADGSIQMQAYWPTGAKTITEQMVWKPAGKLTGDSDESKNVPDVSGAWNFENNVVRIIQVDTEFVAQCTFKHRTGSTSIWIQDGAIQADGSVRSTLYPVLTPPNEIAIGTWIGRLESDGAVRGQASWKAGPTWKAGGHPFTFTRRAVQQVPSPAVD